jgi:hypothetical protein
MKYSLLFLLIPPLIFTPHIVFGEEPVFHGNSEFQRLPTVIGPGQDYRFEIKVHYTEGPYSIKELTPIIDVYPASFSPYITITTKSVDGMVQGSIARMHGTITTDPDIPEGRISLIVYFVAKNIWDTPVRSSWSTPSAPISIESEFLGKNPCGEPNRTKSFPIELEYDVDGGKVISVCHGEDTNSITTKIDAQKDGQITITIPKKIVYSLSSTDCATDSDLFILMDGEEVAPAKSIHTKKDNTITVRFAEGTHVIEFIGAVIIPDPSPDQYCGIVMGFGSPYLPPKFQLKRGMEAAQVRCNEGLLLMILKSEKPACVKPHTTEQLIKRGLANQHSCTNTLFADSGNESLTCFCREDEHLVNGGYYTEKDSSLQIVRKEIISNERNQVGIDVEFFNPEKNSQYAYVWADCR